VIRLTRLNNKPMVLNCDLIKFVEPAPDTMITLVTGDKFVVRESPDEVVRLVVEFRRATSSGIVPAETVHAGLLAKERAEGVKSGG